MDKVDYRACPDLSCEIAMIRCDPCEKWVCMEHYDLQLIECEGVTRSYVFCLSCAREDDYGSELG